MSGAASRGLRLRGVLDGLRAVAESPSAYVYVKDLDGRYILASPLVSETAGQDVIGKTDFDLLPGDLADAASRASRAVLESRTPAEAEEVRGEQTYRMVRVPLIDADGQPMAICGIATDITDYALLAERLFAVQRTEIVGQLASTIAHDFNNLLSVVATRSSLALERVHDDALRSDLEAIQTAVEHGWSLARQMLQFGTRRPRGQPSPGLSQTVLGLELLLERTIAPEIEIETQLEAGDALVAGDGAQLEQIILNLVLNARDAMPEGGKLTVRTVLVHGSDAGDAVGRQISADVAYACLSVSDTGDGMPEHVLARATAPFFTTKPPGHGTGLGLATVQGIVRELKGGLEIESTVHEGTTVRVYLPLTADATRAATTAASPPGAVPAVVLVVAEDDAIREEVTHVLARAGHVALPCVDNGEAVAVLEASDGLLDLIVADTDVPDHGATFARLLEWRTSGGRMLFMSSEPGPDGTGLEPVLRKPFSSRELVRAARRALSSAPSAR